MENDAEATGYLIMAVIRIGAVIYVANRAGSLNRSGVGWGILAFVFPIISLIAIHLVKPRTKWEHETAVEQSNE